MRIRAIRKAPESAAGHCLRLQRSDGECARAAAASEFICVAGPALSINVLHVAEQIVFFCVSALSGGTVFYRWWRMTEEDRRRVWRLYGWFSALMACGSCVGAVAWSAWMMQHVNIFIGDTTHNLAQKTSLFALGNSWRPAFNAAYAIEFMCMCAALLMVLGRMSVFAAPEDADMQKRWAAARRIVMAVVVLGNAVGLAANIAAAVHWHKAADLFSASSASYAANSTKDGDNLYSLGFKEVQLAGSIESVQASSEVAVLLLIILAFLLVGALFTRRLSASMTTIDAAARRPSMDRAARLFMLDAVLTGRDLRLQMLGTTAFVFMTFLLRCVFSTLYAVTFQLRDLDEICPGDEKLGEISVCDASCHNVYTLISLWLFHTPEFQLMVTLISSPIAQLVALWGVTTKSTLQLMKPSTRISRASSLQPMGTKMEESAEMGL